MRGERSRLTPPRRPDRLAAAADVFADSPDPPSHDSSDAQRQRDQAGVGGAPCVPLAAAVEPRHDADADQGVIRQVCQRPPGRAARSQWSQFRPPKARIGGRARAPPTPLPTREGAQDFRPSDSCAVSWRGSLRMTRENRAGQEAKENGQESQAGSVSCFLRAGRLALGEVSKGGSHQCAL